MAKWIDLSPLNDIPAGEHVCLQAAGKPLVLIRTESEDVHVIANICPHAGLPLGEGERRGHVITCPFHGYTYNIKNGRNIDWPHDEPPVKVYETRVHEGVVQVLMQDPDEKPGGPEEEEQPERGPAPADKPGDEPAPCDPSTDPDRTDDPDCPEGYPDRKPTENVPQ